MADGYTHDPDAFDDEDEVVESVDDDGADGSAEPPADAGPPTSTVDPETADREFDWRGWVLVGAIGLCFLVVPGVILAYPYVGRQLGLSFYDTYLALPMVPAVLLALLAVWATTRP